MAVNLSPVGGVAAQFFTSTGAVLTGGKLYTYAAGTTTPATTYTTSQGATAWTNPIVLDAAGRVSGSGEIWLTDGIIYKFVLKDSNDVLIATYDNITGINSNSVSYTNQQEIVTATAGQTVFNLGISYQPGTNSLSVFVDGVNQYGPSASYAYVETDSNTVTFNAGLHVGAEVKFTTTQQQGAGAVDASQVTYDPPFTGSVATNVEAKLAQYVSVKDFGAAGDGVADDTAAIQDALDASYNVYFPAGNYKINGTLTIRPYSNLQGAGKVGYVTSYTENVGEGTRLIQTTNAFLLYTSTGDLDVDYQGHITISDMTLLGGLVTQNEALRGTYGLACYSSQRMICNRVYAGWFSLSGFRFYGALTATMHDCEAEYNQDSGIRMDYGPFGTSETVNSYMSYIQGGRIVQNKNYGIKLDTSVYRVSILDVDIESTGQYFPTGNGVGIYIAGESNTVEIDGCWLEGNKTHILVGDGASLVTVPQATVIRSTELWGVTGTGPKIQILGGTNCHIDACDFKGGGKISVNEFASAPLITNCYSNPSTTPFYVHDNNDQYVQFGNHPVSNVFPYPQIDTWGTTNCTVTVEQVASPAGNVPVYKVTPTAPGLVQIQSTNSVYAFAKNFHTYGWFLKTSSATPSTFWPLLSSVNMPKYYTSQEVNSFSANSQWKWFSIGRCIGFYDTGNQAFAFSTTVANTDPFYITGFVALPGIVYDPYIQQNTGLSALANSATPSVYGLSQALTGGTTTITNFTNGTVGQKFVLISEHAITITDGTNIFLSGSANFVMKATDTLTLIQKADGKWYEIARSVN